MRFRVQGFRGFDEVQEFNGFRRLKRFRGSSGFGLLVRAPGHWFRKLRYNRGFALVAGPVQWRPVVTAPRALSSVG
jgi:hypothetical protein